MEPDFCKPHVLEVTCQHVENTLAGSCLRVFHPQEQRCYPLLPEGPSVSLPVWQVRNLRPGAIKGCILSTTPGRAEPGFPDVRKRQSPCLKTFYF